MAFAPPYDVAPERQAYTLPARPQAGQAPGSDRLGCLILHGYMGSPLSSRPLGEFLADHAITVHCPLLPGHGQYPEKLKGYTVPDWVAEAEEALADIANLCDRVVILGHSMGTILGAHLAARPQQWPVPIEGLIMLTPLYDVPDRRLRAARFLRYFMPWFYPHQRRSLQPLVRQRVLDYDPTVDFDDPAFQKRLPKMTRLPTASLYEMVKTVDMGRDLWPEVRVPSLIFHGGQDPAVKTEDLAHVYDALPGPVKHLEIFEEAGHELMRPLDPAHLEVWQAILDFVAEHVPAEATAIQA